jgi:superfamily II DNA or RNA helicase
MEPIRIYTSNRIFIQNISKPSLPEINAFLQTIYEENTIPNPAYAEAQKRGRWIGNLQSTIPLVRIEKEGISLPRGYASRLFQLAKHFGVEYQFEDLRRELPMVLFRSQIQLRPYQKAAVEAMLKATQGALVAPAGSGKTEAMLEVAARIGQPTLWLTHTKDLARQTMIRAEEKLGLTGNEIGLIGNGKYKIGEKLTIGIIQSLCRMDLTELARAFGLVIIDELHHSCSVTWSGIVDQLPARWKFGCTASWNRADHLEVVTERYIGPVLHKVDRSQVESTGGVIVPHLRTIKTSTISESFDKHNERTQKWERLCGEAQLNYTQEPQKPQMNYTSILLDVTCNEERNHLITQTLIQECPGHFSLVLSERVDHIETLCKMLCESEAGLKCALVHGKLTAKKREAIIASMKSGSLQVLFAVDLAKEGLDIPRLDRLFLVAGGNSEAETEQKVGRIQRASWGKKEAIVFDFVDEAIPVLAAQFWTRRKVYQRLGMLGTDRRQVG